MQRIVVWNLEAARFGLCADINSPQFSYFDDLLGSDRWQALYSDSEGTLIAKQWFVSKNDFPNLWRKVRTALGRVGAKDGDLVCLES